MLRLLSKIGSSYLDFGMGVAGKGIKKGLAKLNKHTIQKAAPFDFYPDGFL